MQGKLRSIKKVIRVRFYFCYYFIGFLWNYLRLDVWYWVKFRHIYYRSQWGILCHRTTLKRVGDDLIFEYLTDEQYYKAVRLKRAEHLDLNSFIPSCVSRSPRRLFLFPNTFTKTSTDTLRITISNIGREVESKWSLIEYT